MADSLELAVRPLRRTEYDKLVELGVFEGERIELLDGARAAAHWCVSSRLLRRTLRKLVCSHCAKPTCR